MSERIVHVTDTSFSKEVLESEGATLVDFWAEWCGPCKMIAPVLEQIAEEYPDSVKVCKLDIDANPNTAPQFGVRGIPTLILFKNGQVQDTQVGAASKQQLQQFLDANL